MIAVICKNSYLARKFPRIVPERGVKDIVKTNYILKKNPAPDSGAGFNLIGYQKIIFSFAI